MELYQLRTFVTVAEEGHLTRSSRRCAKASVRHGRRLTALRPKRLKDNTACRPKPQRPAAPTTGGITP